MTSLLSSSSSSSSTSSHHIQVRPEEEHHQPSWGLFCSDGSHLATGIAGQWSDSAHIAQVDGATFYQTYDVFDVLMLDTERTILTLRSPLLTHFFSIARFRQPLAVVGNGESEWLYSVFGYVLPEYTVGVEIHPSFIEHFVKPRAIDFTFC